MVNPMKQHTQIAPPVTWFGSKSRLVKNIVSFFPAHQTFVDVFGGSGAILLGKKPSKVEVYNDLNRKMACLFDVLRDRDKTRELVRRLELTPYSRDVFQSARQTIDIETDEIELAKLMIVVQRQSHGGLGKQWSYCVDAPAGGYSASVRRFHAGIERLPTIQERMRKVQVENMCYRELLPRYDRPTTLFYLDPPYVPDTRVNGSYEHEMTEKDHSDLVSELLALKGMCILSGYRSEVYSPLEDSGWKRIEIETVAATSKNRTARTECLWISPNSMNQKDLCVAQDIESNETLTNRQKSALRVHQQRKEQSEASITEAIYSLKRMKKKVTKVAVSRMTGISREHITRYYSGLF